MPTATAAKAGRAACEGQGEQAPTTISTNRNAPERTAGDPQPDAQQAEVAGKTAPVSGKTAAWQRR